MRHICEICGYTTSRISNFKDHQARKKPCKKKEIKEECSVKSEVIQNRYNSFNQNNHDISFLMNDHDRDIENDHENINKMMKWTVIEKCEPLNDNQSNNKLKCLKCSKPFKTKRFLKIHEEKCNGLSKLQCEICLKFFSSASSKSAHKRNVKCKPPDNLKSNENYITQDEIQDEKRKKEKEKQLKENEIILVLNGIKNMQKRLQFLRIDLNNYIDTNKLDNSSILYEKSQNQFTAFQKKEIACNQDYKCNLCNIKLPPNYEIDHIKSIANGGGKNIENGQALCKPCHEGKTYQENIERSSLKTALYLHAS